MVTQHLKRNQKSGLFHPVRAGRLYLSIQASRDHYCLPKEDGLKPFQYSKFELAILNQQQRRMSPWSSTLVKSFPKFDKLCELADDIGGPVTFGWVPAELIQELYHHLLDQQS